MPAIGRQRPGTTPPVKITATHVSVLLLLALARKWLTERPLNTSELAVNQNLDFSKGRVAVKGSIIGLESVNVRLEDIAPPEFLRGLAAG